MYVYYGYPAMSKYPKTAQNIQKHALCINEKNWDNFNEFMIESVFFLCCDTAK